MSTFRGVMSEFPDIRVDFFRRDPKLRAPLACFLSHVHSDHLVGLDIYKTPFVYCSPATREILLRLERYPQRLNFALGILERKQQAYKHLDKLLKPIALETPTTLELEPGSSIQVTLFDANHCPGSVMFLFESERTAVLYTGDIRSEAWFVNALTRNPLLLEYTTGVKTLDCVYLDTSNTENISFPSHGDGLKELVSKVLQYPHDTIFHFSAWTYGYERVWLALSKALKSQIHVDAYKYAVYQSLSCGKKSDSIPLVGPYIAYEGPAMTGYHCGNSLQEGCLTTDSSVRIHSCEKCTHCPMLNEKTVWIKPIVTRINGVDIAEIGIGGGFTDLIQKPELQTDTNDALEQILAILQDEGAGAAEEMRHKVLTAIKSGTMATSLADLEILGPDGGAEGLSLGRFTEIVSRTATAYRNTYNANGSNQTSQQLPKRLTFPYSRHSSFPELCALVAVFRPKDVYPCTVDEASWHEGVSIRAKFGRFCSGFKFRHDFEMRALQAHLLAQSASQQTQTTERSDERQSSLVAVNDPCYDRMTVREQDRIDLLSIGATPPPVLIAESPGSESQVIRAKRIMDDVSITPSKRARVLIDGGLSSICEGPASHDNSPTSNRVNETPEVDNDDASALLEHLESDTFYDEEDRIHRCKWCGHELWAENLGTCTGCGYGHLDIPYFEGPDATDGSRPLIWYNDYENEFMEDEERLGLVGDYLDHESSAYDSQDDDPDFSEEYELNSFIDDEESQVSAEEEKSNSDDEECDWQQKFQDEHSVVLQLQSGNAQLLAQNRSLQQELGMYMELVDDAGLLSNYSESMDDEDVDENGIVVINPRAPDPILAEVVLSQPPEPSQDSAGSGGDNVSVRELSAEEFARSWHGVSLVSTRDNHTEPEIEL